MRERAESAPDMSALMAIDRSGVILSRLKDDVCFIDDTLRGIAAEDTSLLMREEPHRLILIRLGATITDISEINRYVLFGDTDPLTSGHWPRWVEDVTEGTWPECGGDGYEGTTLAVIILNLDPGCLKEDTYHPVKVDTCLEVQPLQIALLWHADQYPHGQGAAVMCRELQLRSFGSEYSREWPPLPTWVNRSAGEQAIEIVKLLCDPVAVETMLSAHVPSITRPEDDNEDGLLSRTDTECSDGLPQAGYPKPNHNCRPKIKPKPKP